MDIRGPRMSCNVNSNGYRRCLVNFFSREATLEIALTVIKHHQVSSSTIKHHQASSCVDHHQALIVIKR